MDNRIYLGVLLERLLILAAIGIAVVGLSGRSDGSTKSSPSGRPLFAS